MNNVVENGRFGEFGGQYAPETSWKQSITRRKMTLNLLRNWSFILESMPIVRPGFIMPKE